MRTKCTCQIWPISEDRMMYAYSVFQELGNASCILAHALLINNSVRYTFLSPFPENDQCSERLINYPSLGGSEWRFRALSPHPPDARPHSSLPSLCYCPSTPNLPPTSRSRVSYCQRAKSSLLPSFANKLEYLSFIYVSSMAAFTQELSSPHGRIT